MLHTSAEALRSFPMRAKGFLTFIVGYALIDVWAQTVYAVGMVEAVPSEQWIKYAAGVIPGIVLVLIALKVPSLVRRRYREIIYLFGLLASVGTMGLVFIGSGIAPSSWTLPAEAVVGMTRTFLIVCWLEKFCDLDPRDLLPAFALSVVFGALAKLVLFSVPLDAAEVLLVLLPLVSAVLLQRRHGANAYERALAAVGKGARDAEAPASFRSLFAATPWMLMAALGLVNIPSESLVVLEQVMIGNGAGHLVSTVLHMCVNLAAIALAYAAVRVNIRNSFNIAIVVILLAPIMLAFGQSSSIAILHTASRIGSEMMRYVLIYMCVRLVSERAVPPVFCFGLLMAFHSAGATLGYTVVTTVGQDLLLTAFVLVAVLVVAMLFVSYGQFRLDAEASLDASDESSAALSSAEAFADRYDLTAREREVMELWTAGHNTAYIEDQLSISKYTVRTHLKHIYEKTGTNSKESLITLYQKATGGKD